MTECEGEQRLTCITDVSLCALALSENDWSNFMDTLPRLASLRTLDLSCTKLGNQWGSSLCRLLLHEHLWVVDLSLAGNHLDDSCISDIADYVSSNTVLSTLCLRFNCFGDYSGHCLARSINHHNSLADLDMASNNLQVSGTSVLIQALCFDHTLKKLSLWGNRVGESGLQFLITNSTLRCLDMWNSALHLCDSSLLETFIHSTHITELYLGNNQLTDIGGSAVCRGLLSSTTNSITQLDLSCNQLSGTCTFTLIECIQRCKLKMLNVRDNKFDVTSCILLVLTVAQKAQYPHSEHLQQLNICRNVMSQSDCLHIFNIVKDVQDTVVYFSSMDSVDTYNQWTFPTAHSPVSQHQQAYNDMSAYISQLLTLHQQFQQHTKSSSSSSPPSSSHSPLSPSPLSIHNSPQPGKHVNTVQQQLNYRHNQSTHHSTLTHSHDTLPLPNNTPSEHSSTTDSLPDLTQLHELSVRKFILEPLINSTHWLDVVNTMGSADTEAAETTATTPFSTPKANGPSSSTEGIGADAVSSTYAVNNSTPSPTKVCPQPVLQPATPATLNSPSILTHDQLSASNITASDSEESQTCTPPDFATTVPEPPNDNTNPPSQPPPDQSSSPNTDSLLHAVDEFASSSNSSSTSSELTKEDPIVKWNQIVVAERCDFAEVTGPCSAPPIHFKVLPPTSENTDTSSDDTHSTDHDTQSTTTTEETGDQASLVHSFHNIEHSNDDDSGGDHTDDDDALPTSFFTVERRVPMHVHKTLPEASMDDIECFNSAFAEGSNIMLTNIANFHCTEMEDDSTNQPSTVDTLMQSPNKQEIVFKCTTSVDRSDIAHIQLHREQTTIDTDVADADVADATTTNTSFFTAETPVPSHVYKTLTEATQHELEEFNQQYNRQRPNIIFTKIANYHCEDYQNEHETSVESTEKHDMGLGNHSADDEPVPQSITSDINDALQDSENSPKGECCSIDANTALNTVLDYHHADIQSDLPPSSLAVETAEIRNGSKAINTTKESIVTMDELVNTSTNEGITGPSFGTDNTTTSTSSATSEVLSHPVYTTPAAATQCIAINKVKLCSGKLTTNKIALYACSNRATCYLELKEKKVFGRSLTHLLTVEGKDMLKASKTDKKELIVKNTNALALNIPPGELCQYGSVMYSDFHYLLQHDSLILRLKAEKRVKKALTSWAILCDTYEASGNLTA